MIGRRTFIKRAAAAAGALGSGLVSAPAVLAQPGYPNKPIRFIVPLAPGGAIDFIARAVGERMSGTIGQQIVVENRTGAGGVIGMDAAMKSDPDGYTVLITNDNAASAPHIANLSYDYTKELLPVCYLGRQSQFLAAHSSLGISTVKELVEYAKANPGLGFASSGVGSNQHVAGEWLAKEAGIKLEHVPYRGAGQAINDLIATHVKVAFLGPTALVQHYKAGVLKLLAHTGSKRSRRSKEKAEPVEQKPAHNPAEHPMFRAMAAHTHDEDGEVIDVEAVVVDDESSSNGSADAQSTGQARCGTSGGMAASNARV